MFIDINGIKKNITTVDTIVFSRQIREKEYTSWVYEDKHGFSYMLTKFDFNQTIKDTYQEAQEACVRKLIEIVKEN